MTTDSVTANDGCSYRSDT